MNPLLSLLEAMLNLQRCQTLHLPKPAPLAGRQWQVAWLQWRYLA